MRWKTITAGIIVVFLTLSSCEHQVDEMHIRIRPERGGSFSASGSTALSETEQADPTNTSDYEQAKEIEGKLQKCGLNATTFVRGDRLKVNARQEFDAPEDLAAILQCIPTTWKDATIDVRRSDGWWSATYVTTLIVRQDVLSQKKNNSGRTEFKFINFNDFPARLEITVPGTVSGVEDDSDMLGVKIDVKRPEPDTVAISLTKPFNGAAREAYRRKIQSDADAGRIDAKASPKEDVVKVVVTSAVGKFSIDNILSMIAIVFGSGLVLELLRRLFRGPVYARTP